MEAATESNSARSLAEAIDEYRAQIDKALHAELRRWKNSSFFAPLTNALEGGKRLRSTLLLLSCDCIGRPDDNPLPAAVAVELAHTESLIHDDIIDGDVVRREAAAFHVANGCEMALLSADFVLSVILSITARYADPRIAETLAEATACMSEGQLNEARMARMNVPVPPAEYVNIVSKKTASLFAAAAMIGALIGGASQAEAMALHDYGHSLGVAYQIHDDITDWTHSRAMTLDVQHSSQTECLLELRASSVREALASLERLEPSDARGHLIELARRIDAGDVQKMPR